MQNHTSAYHLIMTRTGNTVGRGRAWSRPLSPTSGKDGTRRSPYDEGKTTGESTPFSWSPAVLALTIDIDCPGGADLAEVGGDERRGRGWRPGRGERVVRGTSSVPLGPLPRLDILVPLCLEIIETDGNRWQFSNRPKQVIFLVLRNGVYHQSHQEFCCHSRNQFRNGHKYRVQAGTKICHFKLCMKQLAIQ